MQFSKEFILMKSAFLRGGHVVIVVVVHFTIQPKILPMYKSQHYFH